MELYIAVLPGDGIGPEVVEQGVKILEAVADRFGHTFHYRYGLVGAAAIDKTGSPLPQDTLDICLNADAVLFGAIGHPKYDNDPSSKVRPEQGLLGLRKALGLYCNVRPVTIFEHLAHLSPVKQENIKGVDLMIYRELISGIYFGEKGRSEDGSYAYDTCSYHAHEVERIAILAFEKAKKRKKKVTLVDKANVLETSRLWREVTKKVSAKFPDVTLETMFVDNAAMQLILNPAQFDIILTENMFGDILSDESSVLAGSMGLIPSASIGEKTSLFEPIHGSFPQAAGKDAANPVATILSVALLLEHLGLEQEVKTIRMAVLATLNEGVGTADLKGSKQYGCSQVGDIIAALVSDKDLKLRLMRSHESSSTII